MNLEHAREAGALARQNGRGIDTCPLYAMGEMGWTLQRAWLSGWNKAEAEFRRLHPETIEPTKTKTAPIRKGRRR